MKILVVCDFTSAHCFAKRLASEDGVEAVYHAWSHSSTKPEGKYIPIYSPDEHPVHDDPSRADQLVDLIPSLGINLLIIMQTTFMFNDNLRESAKKHNVAIFYPDKTLVGLEWARMHFRELIKNTLIPIPPHKLYQARVLRQEFHRFKDKKFVVKFDRTWLNGEQTRIVTSETYQQVYDDICKSEYDDTYFIIEQFVEGPEYSYHAIVSESDWRFLGAARDYKRMYDGERGPNTNGMGAYGLVDVHPIVHEYVDIIIEELKKREDIYVGFLYLGIKVDPSGVPVVLEMNVRPGCPELQTILPSVENNLAKLIFAAATNKPLDKVKHNNKKTVTVITSRHDSDDEHYFVSCNKERNCYVVTSDSVKQATEQVYGIVDKLDKSAVYYRTDIGHLR